MATAFAPTCGHFWSPKQDCGAGELSYDLTFSSGDASTTATSEVRVRPVHYLAPLLLGYDLAFRRSFDTHMADAIRSTSDAPSKQ